MIIVFLLKRQFIVILKILNPNQKAREMTKELKKVNTEIYTQKAEDLRENCIKGVELPLNSNNKEIHIIR